MGNVLSGEGNCLRGGYVRRNTSEGECPGEMSYLMKPRSNFRVAVITRAAAFSARCIMLAAALAPGENCIAVVHTRRDKGMHEYLRGLRVGTYDSATQRTASVRQKRREQVGNTRACGTYFSACTASPQLPAALRCGSVRNGNYAYCSRLSVE